MSLNPKTAANLRSCVLFWILVPMGACFILFAVLEIGERLGGGNSGSSMGDFSFGAALLVAVAPFIGAHVILVSSAIGVVGLILGLRPDRTLITSILLGLVVGGAVLKRIYFG